MAERSPVRADHADPETILNRMADGFLALDDSWSITYANAEGQSILQSAIEEDATEIVGQNLWGLVPDSRDSVFFEEFTDSMSRQEPVSFESYYERLEVWLEVRCFPSDSGLSVYFRDISDYKELSQDRQEGLYALQQLYAISSDRTKDFRTKTSELLELGCDFLDLSNGFMTRIEQGQQYIAHSVATHPQIQEENSCPLDEAYCKRTIELDSLLTVVNASDEGWEDDPAYDRFEFESYIGGRLSLDGDLYGTLCFAETEATPSGFTDTQRTFVELLTRWLEYELERNQATEQLIRERDRLDEFTQVVSHDLRNPLNTVTGHIELLTEETESDHLPPIERALSQMEQLIDDLLTLARDGRKVENPSETHLPSVVQQSWTIADVGELELSVTTGDINVLADSDRLQQVFENLFRNASKHGGSTTEIEVGLLSHKPGFYVADDGKGIPTSELDQVFEPGYTTRNDGTGFGLNIVDDIASAHGWSIEVTESASGGARFEVHDVEFADTASHQ